jgi:hypothetical protein
MQSPNKKKSQRNMLMVLGAFILPIIFAKLALDQHWFNYGVTNKGALVADDLNLEKLGLKKENFNHKWLIIYAAPNQCTSICAELLHSINNTYVALGEEVKRVTPVTLTSTPLNTNEATQLSAKAWQQLNFTAGKQQVKQNQVFIADPLGNVVLSYSLPTQVEQLPSFGKAILADLKKLLKYSRIG